MFKLATVHRITVATLLVICADGAAVAAPPCLPAALALSSTPAGAPVAANVYWPTVSNAPVTEGLAVFWHCQVGADVQVVEWHGTREAIARAGGLRALQSRYLNHKDDALAELDVTGHTCIDPDARPDQVARRPDCVALPDKKGQPRRYLCLNPKVTGRQEARLCKHVIDEAVAQWPQ
jgi:hypothetical protein